MTKYIAIDGDGGAGKTYLSNILAEKLHSPVLHLDEFGDDCHPFIGIPAMIEAAKLLNDEVVILEGIGVFDDRFDFLEPFRVFVDTPDDLRAARAMGRDKPTVNRSAEEWKKIYRIWEDQASQYINDAPNKAALIVQNSDEGVADFIIERANDFWARV